MKTKINYLLFCDQVIIDKGGKPSFIGIFDKIIASQTPVIYSKFSIVFTLSGTPNQSGVQKVEVVSEKDKKSIITPIENQIKFDENGTSKFIVDLVNVKFAEFGKYPVQIFMDNELISDLDKHYVPVELA